MLKQDWDYAPHIRKRLGHHVIRKKEHELIVDFLFRREEGTLLLGGRRGVGKTSAIFTALNDVIDRCEKQKRKVLPILVNAPGFQLSVSDSSERLARNGRPRLQSATIKRSVLQNLVRRLYSATVGNLAIDESTRKKISTLFIKAVAKEVREETKAELFEENEVENKKVVSSNVGLKLSGISVSILSSLILTLNPIPTFGLWNTILPILVGIIPPFGILVKWTTSENHRRGETGRASSYYLLDHDTDNLQAELEDALGILSSKCKVIFVIDELDKIGLDDLTDIISGLKLLFNQSAALFVLVVGEEYFTKLVRVGKARDIEYTLFSQKVFLTRPLFQEMEEFINNIMVRTSDELDVYVDYHLFRNYVCYKSRTDFFDLYAVIRDHIIGYKDSNPRIDIKLQDQKSIIQAKLQKAMGQIFLLKAFHQPSDWYRNDQLLEKMYDLIDRLSENKVGSQCLIELNEDGMLKNIKFNQGSVSPEMKCKQEP